MTGYPSNDKHWLKYYSEEAINAKIPKCAIYEYLYENNKNHLDEAAINYVGRWITYHELFQNIDRIATSYLEEGIGEGDIVTIIAPSIPEIIYSFYALNKMGAVSNFIDPQKCRRVGRIVGKYGNESMYCVRQYVGEVLWGIE